jgi:Ran GTPase-activating protein (RanGAP) involved in mRNA processing and transport
MREQGPALSQLRLRRNQISAGVAKECCRIAHAFLSLSCSAIRSALREQDVAGVLPQCPELSELDLTYNETGPDGAERLAVVLPQCHALAHLNLSYNQIGVEGAGSAAQCPTLSHPQLGGIRSEPR